MRPTRLSLLSVCHFLVDFACACFLLRCLGRGEDWKKALLWYNFCAFALQMPLGLLADWLGRERFFGGGCVLVACGALLTGVPAVTALGVGNALFHIGGGVEVLYSTENLGPLGVFVAPGAVGLALGLQLSRSESGGPVWRQPCLLSRRHCCWAGKRRVSGPISHGEAGWTFPAVRRRCFFPWWRSGPGRDWGPLFPGRPVPLPWPRPVRRRLERYWAAYCPIGSGRRRRPHGPYAPGRHCFSSPACWARG